MNAARSRLPGGARGFTLTELLVVLAIIGVLACLLLGAGDMARRKAAASRARVEIAALATALQKYKLDYDNFPVTTAIATNSATGYTVDPSAYADNAAVLFAALAGRVRFDDPATGTVYYEFKRNQASTNSVGAGDCAIDPFKNPYGFTTDVTDSSNASTNTVYNRGFFDLWSTVGQPASAPQTNNWIANWKDGS